jgi:hypothetical protein
MKLFLIISFIFLFSIISVNAAIPLGVEFLVEGVPSGNIGARYSSLMFKFDSNVNKENVIFTIYYEGEQLQLNPDRCELQNCFIDDFFFSRAGEIEFSLSHLSNSINDILYIDNTNPTIENVRFYKRNNEWFIYAEVLDYLDASSSYPGKISRIEIIKDSNIIDTINNINLQNYIIDKKATFEPSESRIDFTIKVHDVAGYVNSIRFNRQVDDFPPRIISINNENNEWYLDTRSRILVTAIIEEDDRIDVQNSKIKIDTIEARFDSCTITSPILCTARIEVPSAYIDNVKTAIITIQDSYGNQDSKSVSFTTRIDTSQPQLATIWSDAPGYTSGAFLSNNEFYAEFSDALSGMDSSQTIANVDGLEVSASRCEMRNEYSRCYFDPRKTGTMNARIVRGMDNAGNSMVSSSLTTIFETDSNPPSIQVGMGTGGSFSSSNEVSINTGSNAQIRIAKTIDSGSKLSKIEINVTSISSNEIIHTIKFNDINSCNAQSDYLICNIPPFVVQESYSVKGTVYDGAGNTASFNRIIFSGDTLHATDNWRMTSLMQKTKYYFSGIPSQFSTELTMSPGITPYEMSIAQSSGTCTSDKGTVESLLISSDRNTVSVNGMLNTQSSVSGNANISCELNIYSRRDRLVSTDFDTINFWFLMDNFDITNHPGSPGNRALDGSMWQFLSSDWALTVLGKAEDIVEIGEGVCGAYALYTGVSAGVDAAAGATGDTLSIINTIARTLDISATEVEKFAESKCGFVFCTTDGSKELLDTWYGMENNLLGNLSELGVLSLTQSTNRNVQDSFVQSVFSVCVPGMIKNIRKLQQVQCGYALCLLDAEDGRVPASYCEYSQATATCEVFGSELFTIVPFGLIVKDIGISVNSYITRPITVAGGFVLDLILRESPTYRAVIKMRKYIYKLLPMFEIVVQTTSSTPTVDYCSQLETIRGANN